MYVSTVIKTINITVLLLVYTGRQALCYRHVHYFKHYSAILKTSLISYTFFMHCSNQSTWTHSETFHKCRTKQLRPDGPKDFRSVQLQYVTQCE